MLDWKTKILTFLMVVPAFVLYCIPGAANISLKDRIEGALIGAALGDALGRITEFIPTTAAIRTEYGSNGLKSFEQFRPHDWVVYNKQKIAPYTDDTVMAKLLLEISLEAKKNDWSPDKTIGKLAQEFALLFGPEKYSRDPLYALRAHGPTNEQAGYRLFERMQHKDTHCWWVYGPSDYDYQKYSTIEKEGGCGSVMRAWPLGLVYKTDRQLMHLLADEQSRLTHRHPMARAACVALAEGIASVLDGVDVTTVAQNMINVARRFDNAELVYKKKAGKVSDSTLFNQAMIKNDTLLTSDMLSYATVMAQKGYLPEQVLGYHNNKGTNFRSTNGFLLGWAADEALAAALYVFMRHPDNLHAALVEAVNTPGDSDSIATLAGALVGARVGSKQLAESGFDYSRLENVSELICLAEQFAHLVS